MTDHIDQYLQVVDQARQYEHLLDVYILVSKVNKWSQRFTDPKYHHQILNGVTHNGMDASIVNRACVKYGYYSSLLEMRCMFVSVNYVLELQRLNPNIESLQIISMRLQNYVNMIKSYQIQLEIIKSLNATLNGIPENSQGAANESATDCSSDSVTDSTTDYCLNGSSDTEFIDDTDSKQAKSTKRIGKQLRIQRATVTPEIEYQIQTYEECFRTKSFDEIISFRDVHFVKSDRSANIIYNFIMYGQPITTKRCVYSIFKIRFKYYYRIQCQGNRWQIIKWNNINNNEEKRRIYVRIRNGKRGDRGLVTD
jgi:hypothetical protein